MEPGIKHHEGSGGMVSQVQHTVEEFDARHSVPVEEAPID